MQGYQVSVISSFSQKNKPFFSLAKLILFCKYKQMLFLVAATHSKTVGTEAK